MAKEVRNMLGRNWGFIRALKSESNLDWQRSKHTEQTCLGVFSVTGGLQPGVLDQNAEIGTRLWRNNGLYAVILFKICKPLSYSRCSGTFPTLNKFLGYEKGATLQVLPMSQSCEN